MSPGPDDGDRIERVLTDLGAFAATAERIVARGVDAYFDRDDDILRRAGRSVIIDVSAAVDRLPTRFTRRFPDVPWREIRATRNRIAHQYDAVRDEVIWETLRSSVPALARRLTGPSS